jgi:hypothetical protein
LEKMKRGEMRRGEGAGSCKKSKDVNEENE